MAHDDNSTTKTQARENSSIVIPSRPEKTKTRMITANDIMSAFSNAPNQKLKSSESASDIPSDKKPSQPTTPQSRRKKENEEDDAQIMASLSIF